MKIGTYLQVLMLMATLVGCSDEDGRLVMYNGACQLAIELDGGAITSFRLTGSVCNPFTWQMAREDMPVNNREGAPFHGHFLCLGRWGEPTEGEMKMGMPHNGQIGNSKWRIVSSTSTKAALQATSELDYMVLNRTVELAPSTAVVKITDCVKSTATVGRLCNIVQHATVGPPFLNELTTIESNAADGFMQHLCHQNPERWSYHWPVALADTLGHNIDLTNSSEPTSYVSTHLMADDVAWIAAASPETRLLLGYIWRRADYPWLNLWHQRQEGKLWAKGMEFGTAGVGGSYQQLLATDSRFRGQKSFFYLDAGETVEKTFICFLLNIPHNYRGVDSLQLSEGCIIVKEKQSGKVSTIDCPFKL